MREKKRAKREAAEAARPQELRKTERYVPTSDDWYPSFMRDETTGKYVCIPRSDDDEPVAPMYVLIYARLVRTGDKFHVTVSAWGGDDHSVVRRIDNIADEDEGQREYERWAKWLSDIGLVTHSSLQDIGFGPD